MASTPPALPRSTGEELLSTGSVAAETVIPAACPRAAALVVQARCQPAAVGHPGAAEGLR